MKKVLFLVFVGVIAFASGLSCNVENGTKSNAKVAEKHSSNVHELRDKAENGDAEAQFSLGEIYFAGRGVEQDYKEAVKWFRKATEQGNVTAQLAIGSMYLEGIGVEQDSKEGVKWVRMAVEQGDANAQNGLGVMYAIGKGVIKDNVKAYKWFILAEKNGYDTGGSIRNLEKDMTAGQIAEAQRLANEFVQK